MPAPPAADDLSIPNQEILYRRLPPAWLVLGEGGRARISSAAFKHEELSVFIHSLLLSQQRSPTGALQGFPGQALCSITAGLAREMALGVVYDAEPPNDPAHGLVVGKKTQAVANRLARAAVWVVPEQPPAIETGYQ
jgi:hypothetical protein